MRLTGGMHGGRLLQVPPGGATRPTQDKVRAALYSSLAARIPGSRVLDLFAGSGAVGLEAWSREAAWVEWVEADKTVAACLRKNMKALNVPAVAGRLVQQDVFKYLGRPCPAEPFDIIFADPPYAMGKQYHWPARLLTLLAENQWLHPSGIFVLETEGRDEPPAHPAWHLIRDKLYGATRLLFWTLAELPAGSAAESI